MIHLLDLHQQGETRVIGSYLLDGPDGPTLVDCGPASCVSALKAGLNDHGLELRGVRNLLLTHIHLDHAGAAGTLAREHAELQIYVSPIGAPHLIDPSKLEQSARRLFGDSFDRLWGEVVPVPEAQVHRVAGQAAGLASFPSPGHAAHHVCYFDERTGTLFAGDAAGVRIAPSEFVLPATAPPEIDLEAWESTLAQIRARRPLRLALPHFGFATDPERHVDELEERLLRWSEIIRDGVSKEDFVSLVGGELAEAGEDPQRWEDAAPFEHLYLGLERYWRKRSEAPTVGGGPGPSR